MLQFVLSLCLETAKKLINYLMPAVGLIISSTGLFMKQRIGCACITVLIIGTFYLSCGMIDIYAVPEIQKSEKILDIDDSEVVPAMKEKLDQIGNAKKENIPDVGSSVVVTANEQETDDTKTTQSIQSIAKEKVKEKIDEWAPLAEKTEEPSVSVSTRKPQINKKILHNFNLGIYYQKQGDNTKAIEAYENVLKLDPDNAEVHNNLGVIYKEQDDLDKAMEHFQHVVSFNPGMDEAHNNLGLIHYLRGDQRNAVLEYQKALKLNPNNLVSQINLGLVYKAQGLDKKAIDTIENVLSEDSLHPEAHYNLAILYEEMGHMEKALWHYTRFVDNAENDYLTVTEKVTEHIKDLKVISGDVLRE